MKFVLDCSITMSWCFDDETTPYTEKVLSALNADHIALVPTIWKYEVCNVLLLTERKQRISLLQANNFKNALSSLPIHTQHGSTDRAFETIFELGRELSLTSYDAAYLELSFREKIPLATKDKGLIHAAKKISIDLW